LPAHVDLEQAAITLWSFSTAHRVVVDRMRVGIGETLLVIDATGAMGVATVQLGKLRGARVIAACRAPPAPPLCPSSAQITSST
jgi:NADPH:quinone reductase-like Zn-dependent oxidoreductase